MNKSEGSLLFKKIKKVEKPLKIIILMHILVGLIVVASVFCASIFRLTVPLKFATVFIWFIMLTDYAVNHKKYKAIHAKSILESSLDFIRPLRNLCPPFMIFFALVAMANVTNITVFLTSIAIVVTLAIVYNISEV